MKERRNRKKGGFSLVEVCLAVLVVGLGLLSVFSMFPTGLAASESAQTDTATGLFAEQVMWGLQAVAPEVSWADWKINNFDIPDIPCLPSAVRVKDDIAYYLEISGDARGKKATLYTIPWKAETLPQLDVVKGGNMFYTEIYYMELPLP